MAIIDELGLKNQFSYLLVLWAGLESQILFFWPTDQILALFLSPDASVSYKRLHNIKFRAVP